MEESDDEAYRVARNSPVKIINIRANITTDLCSPSLFKKYILPYYRRRTDELRKAGKFVTSHWDGNVKHLMPYVKQTGLDGLECVPPKPQGDVTLGELKQGLEDMVLVDGIPATLFLPEVSNEKVEEYAHRVLRLFSPQLIAGISDKLPPNGDIEKVKLVGEIVKNFNP